MPGFVDTYTRCTAQEPQESVKSMSHNSRSRTYMQMAARERGHRAQIVQIALALLVLLSIVLWNQLGQPRELGHAEVIEQQNVQLLEQAPEAGLLGGL